MEGAHPASAFYRLQFGAALGWWLLVRRATGKTLDQVAMSSVFTRPSWVPASWLSKMHRSGVRKIIFALPLAGLGAGALVARDKTPPMLLRLAVAGAVSLYHLLEHSTTQRHGEFPLLYNAWAMVLPDGRYASAASFGIGIHFVLSSGVSKLLIGGRQWLASTTMRTYLSIYCDSEANPPLSKRLNRMACARSWATTSLCPFLSPLSPCSPLLRTGVIIPRGRLRRQRIARRSPWRTSESQGARVDSAHAPALHAQARIHARARTHTHTHVCVCVCVCTWQASPTALSRWSARWCR